MLLSQPDFDTSKEYTITDLIELAFPQGDATDGDADEAKAQAMRAAKALQYALKSEAVRADLTAMARDMAYNLRIEKKRVKGEKKEKYRFIFRRLEVPQESHRLRAILQRLGVAATLGEDDDDALPPPATTPPTPTTIQPPPSAPTLILPPSPTPPPVNMADGVRAAYAAPGLSVAADMDGADGVAAVATGAETDARQNGTKPLTDMVEEKMTTPIHPVAGGNAEPNSPTGNIPQRWPLQLPVIAPNSLRPTQRNPRPPVSGCIGPELHQKHGNGGVSDGLFTPNQDAQGPPYRPNVSNRQRAKR
jgi:hypothetical protein